MAEGTIRKMKTENAGVVNYYLPVGDERIFMNELIGKGIKMVFLNEIHCIGCGRITSRSFAQGYCYPCLLNSPETSECIIHPEKCMAHEGVSRDMEWSREHCLQDHVVYLADTTGLKVGVTRLSQIPTRWMDQGATKAVRIARTPNRYLAGRIEVELKKIFADKTNWRNMLVNKNTGVIDLIEEKERAREVFPFEFRQYFDENSEITNITYPVDHYPVKVKPVSFDKMLEISGVLTGIKGQYMIFENGNVLNIRKHNGYMLSFQF